MVLVVGGKRGMAEVACLKTFKIFFDDIVFTWENDWISKLKIGVTCELKNKVFWGEEKIRRSQTKLETNNRFAPSSDFVRSAFYKNIVPQAYTVKLPEEIPSPILRAIATKSHAIFVESNGKKGLFWNHLQTRLESAIWQERSFFNPLEATVEYILEKNHFDFTPQIKVPTLLQELRFRQPDPVQFLSLVHQRISALLLSLNRTSMFNVRHREEAKNNMGNP